MMYGYVTYDREIELLLTTTHAKTYTKIDGYSLSNKNDGELPRWQLESWPKQNRTIVFIFENRQENRAFEIGVVTPY